MSSYAAQNAKVVEDEERAMSEINTTPLVDVMLVLLIVFMITMIAKVDFATTPPCASICSMPKGFSAAT